MTDTATERRVVLPEASDIQAGREQLEAIRERLTDAPKEVLGFHGERNLGRLIQAVADAEYALFRVLVVAHAYSHCAESELVLDRANGKEPE